MNIILIISTIILPIMSLQIFTFQTPIIYDKDDLSVKSNSYPITFKDADPKGSAFEMLHLFTFKMPIIYKGDFTPLN